MWTKEQSPPAITMQSTGRAWRSSKYWAISPVSTDEAYVEAAHSEAIGSGTETE